MEVVVNVEAYYFLIGHTFLHTPYWFILNAFAVSILILFASIKAHSGDIVSENGTIKGDYDLVKKPTIN